MTRTYSYTGVVVYLHDGDTIEVKLDLGFNITFLVACRFYGCNAPELSTQAGKDALAYLQTLIKPGDSFSVVSYGWDKYGGRFDGLISINGIANLSQQMIDSGHAVPMAG